MEENYKYMKSINYNRAKPSSGRMTKTFTELVRSVVKNIPKGKVLTYKQVATLAGSPGASRAVGSIMKNNYDPKIPCHRVVRSDGKVGGYNRGGSVKKLVLLKKEGWRYN